MKITSEGVLIMPVVDIMNIQKKASALYIQYSLSNTIATQLEEIKSKTKTAVKDEVSTLKEDLSSNTEKLAKSVTGEFGKKAKETIESESKKVDKF